MRSEASNEWIESEYQCVGVIVQHEVLRQGSCFLDMGNAVRRIKVEVQPSNYEVGDDDLIWFSDLVFVQTLQIPSKFRVFPLVAKKGKILHAAAVRKWIRKLSKNKKRLKHRDLFCVLCQSSSLNCLSYVDRNKETFRLGTSLLELPFHSIGDYKKTGLRLDVLLQIILAHFIIDLISGFLEKYCFFKHITLSLQEISGIHEIMTRCLDIAPRTTTCNSVALLPPQIWKLMGFQLPFLPSLSFNEIELSPSRLSSMASVCIPFCVGSQLFFLHPDYDEGELASCIDDLINAQVRKTMNSSFARLLQLLPEELESNFLGVDLVIGLFALTNLSLCRFMVSKLMLDASMQTDSRLFCVWIKERKLIVRDIEDRDEVLSKLSLPMRISKRYLLYLALNHKIAKVFSEIAFNERLEFLGDLVLDFLVCRLIYSMYPNISGEEISKRKSVAVRNESLAFLARDWKLDQLLVPHVKDPGTKFLSDTVEALFGAYFLDQGLPRCGEIIEQVFSPILEGHDWIRAEPKTVLSQVVKRLLESPQVSSSKRLKSVSYSVVEEKQGYLKVVASIGYEWASGTGRSKSDAEKAAARNLIGKIQQSYPWIEEI